MANKLVRFNIVKGIMQVCNCCNADTLHCKQKYQTLGIFQIGILGISSSKARHGNIVQNLLKL